MKKTARRFVKLGLKQALLFLCIALLNVAVVAPAFAQGSKPPVELRKKASVPAIGRWEGFLVIGKRQYLIQVEFFKKNGAVTGLFDLAGRRIRGLSITGITIEGPKVHFEVMRPRETWVFDGQISDKTLAGRMKRQSGPGRFILQRAPKKKVEKPEAILKRINNLGGNVSFQFQKLGAQASNIALVNSSQAFLTGQCDQLALLAFLSPKIRAGESIDYVLEPGSRSRAPGACQKFPNGTKVSVTSAASLMVTLNDQTAFDLIVRRHRAEIEAYLEQLKVGGSSVFKPFLATREYFQLTETKFAGFGQKYVKADAKQRREMLKNLDKIDMPKYRRVEKQLANLIGNRLSVSDLSLMIQDIYKGADPKAVDKDYVFELLTESPQPRLASRGWSYYGFLSHTEERSVVVVYVLQYGEDQWFSLCAAWANPVKPINIDVFNDLVQQYIESYKLTQLETD